MPTVFYDEECGFCSDFIKRIRKIRKMRDVGFFDITQIDEFIYNGEKLSIQGIDSIIVIDNENIKIYSSAIIKLFILAGGIYKVIGFCCLLVPRQIRDLLYKFVARNRYRIFGGLKCKAFK
jgi:predicted DCC family thiol-disulfide oxidoreductase YuxK